MIKKIKTEFVNMTPHDIVVQYEEFQEHSIDCYPFEVVTRTFSASGTVARLKMDTEKIGETDGIPIFRKKVAGHNLPAKKKHTKLIVSSMVLEALKGERDDLIAPNTDEAKRNEKGHIISVPSFVS